MECLDEQLVEYASGGAIAVTGPNPCGTPTGNHYLYREMMKKVYLEHELVLGRIVYDAKCRIINQYFPIDSLYGPAVLVNLLGDPALRLKYGPPVGVQEGKIARRNPVFAPLARYLVIPVAGPIAVYDPLGQCVYNDPDAAAGTVIDLASGVYFIRHQSGGVPVVEKIVITH